MIKKTFGATLLLCGLATVQAQAACDYPSAPGKFPDGTQASRDEMLAAKKIVVQYNDDITAYVTCLKVEFDEQVAASGELTSKRKSELQRVHAQKEQAAIDEVTTITERFNEQLRAWQAKNAEKK